MSKPENQFFRNAEETTCALASMLIHLDKAGQIQPDMREAIRNHAVNKVETLPMGIASAARALASSSQGTFSIGTEDAANAAYGLASMAEQMEGFLMMVNHFDDVLQTTKTGAVAHV
jgi:hypothetical protein